MTEPRIAADDPRLAINIITRALEISNREPTRSQAGAVIMALHRAGYRITSEPR